MSNHSNFTAIRKFSIFTFFSFILCLPFSAHLVASEMTKSSTSTFKSLTVNINKASADEIADVMTGVGVSKAKFIVAYRKKVGAFKSIDDLLNVKGIGAVTLEKNRHKLKL